MYYSSRAIILKTKDYRETDKLVSLFSEKEGKLRAVAKGVKKPNSSLRACVQPFCHSFLSLSGTKELDLITQARLLDFYGDIREDLERTLYAVYIMELLDKSLMERAAMPRVYHNTLEILEYINKNGAAPLVIRYFEMKLLIELGYRPQLNECIHCGQKNRPMYNFSLSEGSIVCEECARVSKVNFYLSPESISLLKLLTTGRLTTIARVKASASALKQVELFLERYLEYYLERKFNMKNTIRMLKQAMSVRIDKV